MKIYALICHKLDLTQFWPKLVSWRFDVTTDEVLKVDVLFMQFSILTLFSGKMLPHEDIGIKVPFVQLLQVCLGKGEHSDQFP